MRAQLGPVLAFAIVSVASEGVLAAGPARCGPVEDPEKWADYGGTPDIAISKELGLSTTEIETLLARLTAPDQAARVSAAVELKRDAAGSEEALREVLWGGHGARNAEMKQAVREARRRAERSGEDTGLLAALLALDPNDAELGKGTRAATRVMAILVALQSLNTQAGYKVLIEFSPRHAGVFRQECGRMLVAGGFDALPALIYGRGSKSKELHRYSVKWIRDLGNPLLGEQVAAIKNPRRLAQLLEAYASVNEFDAIDVTLSLTNHESVFVRCAARACLEVYGVNARWQVRRTYENTFARPPGKDTTLPDWRQELYEHFDAERIAREMSFFEEGQRLFAQEDLAGMAERYRTVLRHAPMFPKRHEMAAGFLARAAELEEDEQLEGARAATLLALRIALPGSAEDGKARARLRWIEAEVNRLGGAADRETYAEVARMDPSNDDAEDWVAALSGDQPGLGRLGRKAALVSLFVFLAALLAVRRAGWFGLFDRE